MRTPTGCTLDFSQITLVNLPREGQRRGHLHHGHRVRLSVAETYRLTET